MKFLSLIFLTGVTAAGGCSFSSMPGAGTTPPVPGGGGGTPIDGPRGTTSADATLGINSDATGSNTGGVWPPPGFINVTASTVGGYALGPEHQAGSANGPAAQDGGAASGQCGGLYGLVRDFKMGNHPGGHPDFETMSGDDHNIVGATLGADGKPVYAPGTGKSSTTTGKTEFNQWYNDTAGVNRTFVLGLHLIQQGNLFTFQADRFFPVDGQGFGNEGEAHNFSFTTEIHTAFTYRGGETFTFIGDDDVFVFINKKLAIDLGGRHAQETGTVNLDADAARFGLVKNSTYDLAVFHAERHTTESHFRIDTSLAFVNCGQLPDGYVIP